MKTPEAHTDPFIAFFDRLKEEIIAGVSERLQQDLPPQVLELEALGIEPLRAYSAKEVACLLGTSRVASIYEIPEGELPRVRRVGTGVGFLGINVLCYMHGLPPIDVAATVEQYRQRLLHERPRVQALHPVEGGKTRVL